MEKEQIEQIKKNVRKNAFRVVKDFREGLTEIILTSENGRDTIFRAEKLLLSLLEENKLI